MREYIDRLNGRYSDDELKPYEKVLRMASDFGLRVDVWDFGEGGPSWLWSSGDRWVVVLNASDSPEDRAFALAHELIHYIAHRNVRGTVFANDCSVTTAKNIEMEANREARHLLLPDSLMFTFGPPFDPQKIARKLKVPEEVVTRRIRELGGGMGYAG